MKDFNQRKKGAEWVPMKRNSLKQVVNTKRENKEKERASGFRLLGKKSMLNRYVVISKCLGLEEFTHWTIPLPTTARQIYCFNWPIQGELFCPFLAAEMPHHGPLLQDKGWI